MSRYESMKTVDRRQWLPPCVKKSNAPLERLSGYIWDLSLHLLALPALACAIDRLPGLMTRWWWLGVG